MSKVSSIMAAYWAIGNRFGHRSFSFLAWYSFGTHVVCLPRKYLNFDCDWSSHESLPHFLWCSFPLRFMARLRNSQLRCGWKRFFMFGLAQRFCSLGGRWWVVLLFGGCQVRCLSLSFIANTLWSTLIGIHTRVAQLIKSTLICYLQFNQPLIGVSHESYENPH